jgi:23S rRNA pseudouridine2604 synthase
MNKAPPATATPKRHQAPGERLVRRVMQVTACSRGEAENYITGGWVRVNGVVIELPGHRVSNETVTLDPQATLLPQPPVTLLLHKPPGFDALPDALAGLRPAWKLLAPSNHANTDKSGIRMLQQHFVDLASASPLEAGASGLVVFTKDWRVQRKLVEDAARVEHELMVQVRGTVTPEALRWLNQSQVIDGRAMLAAKVSISSQPEAKPNSASKTEPLTGLRFALKGHHIGQIDQLCRQVKLQVVAMKRTRVGRVALADLPVGQWRYLGESERF